MSFLDELKGKCRSTAEVEKEKQASLIDKVNRDAQETADRIKRGLLMSVERGEYTYIGDKKQQTLLAICPLIITSVERCRQPIQKTVELSFQGNSLPLWIWILT